MRRLLVAVLTVACVAGSTPVFARHAGHSGRGHAHVNTHATRLAPAHAPRPNPIPAPLGSPSPAPTINGPISQPAFRGLNGIGQR
jgi:hypothetical protein